MAITNAKQTRDDSLLSLQTSGAHPSSCAVNPNKGRPAVPLRAVTLHGSSAPHSAAPPGLTGRHAGVGRGQGSARPRGQEVREVGTPASRRVHHRKRESAPGACLTGGSPSLAGADRAWLRVNRTNHDGRRPSPFSGAVFGPSASLIRPCVYDNGPLTRHNGCSWGSSRSARPRPVCGPVHCVFTESH